MYSELFYLGQIVWNFEFFDEFPRPNSDWTANNAVLLAVLNGTQVPVVRVEISPVVLTSQVHRPAHDLFLCVHTHQQDTTRTNLATVRITVATSDRQTRSQLRRIVQPYLPDSGNVHAHL